MADTIYAYKGRYWKPIHNFQYTGKTEEFTLNPGKYLLICHGAQGGQTGNQAINYGGVAYGVLNLKNETKLYATVGGNGGPSIDNSTPGVGGFNGGGNGGHSYNNNYNAGAGGGGATDIRVLPPDTPEQTIVVEKSLPEEYQEVEYISSSGTQYIDTLFVPTSTMKAEIRYSFNNVGNKFYGGIFGSCDPNITTRIQLFQNVSSHLIGIGSGYTQIPGEDYEIHTAVIDIMNMRSYLDDVEYFATYGRYSNNPMPTNTIALFGRHKTDTEYECGDCKMYHVKIWDNDRLVRYYIPCYRKSDNVCGMYDLILGEFWVNNGTGEFIPGNNVETPTVFSKDCVRSSLHSRLIVAGGGGGSTNMTLYPNYSGNGGGVVGGIMSSGNDSFYCNSYATQSDGFSFGKGMDAVDKNGSSSDQGASGGGGGWFGGYANGSPNKNNSASNGGGGSGYVFTSDSYKPIEGYDNGTYMIGEEYYLTDTFLDGGQAIQPQALVCEPVNLFNNGDTIIFPCIGETEHIILPKGKYVFKCYGGDGGTRLDINGSARGGYAEGVFDNPQSCDVYVNVGGSGIGTGILNSEYSQMNRRTTMFNGGGAPGKMGDINCCAGGGSSDIRIGSDSLYSRIIVAGGAGGQGKYNGGAGGGETGDVCQNSGCGTSPGPGTQTETPQNTSYKTINGGFGYGGNGVMYNNGYGGAGGGGWFGGSGTYPDNSGDDDKGGNGGSGYVLTKESYKPEEYLLDDRYYLTNTSLITGGNTLPVGHSEIIIQVIECMFISIICHDEEGYKRFDQSSNKWVYFSSELTPEMFDEYGYHVMKTDEGLLNEYDIIIRDSGDKIFGIECDVVPPKQTISTTVKHRMNVSSIVPDIEFDEDVYDVEVNAEKTGVGSNSTIILNTTIHKKEVSDQDIRIYCVQVYDK